MKLLEEGVILLGDGLIDLFGGRRAARTLPGSWALLEC